MNFGTILNSVTKNCVKLMIESDDSTSKELARNFVNFIGMKDVLKRQFSVYTQLGSSYIRDRESARQFVSEVVSILDGVEFEDIKAYNALLETKFSVSKMKSTDINHHIANLIKHRTSSVELDKRSYIDSFNFVVEYITTIRETKSALNELDESLSNSPLKFLEPKHVVRIAIKKFNDEYGSKFDKEDRKVFFTLKEGTKEDINNLHSNITNEVEEILETIVMDKELHEKSMKALQVVSEICNEDNILDAYDMLCELKSIKESNNG